MYMKLYLNDEDDSITAATRAAYLQSALSYLDAAEKIHSAAANSKPSSTASTER